MYMHTDKQAYWQLHRHIDGETDGHTYKHKHKYKHTDRDHSEINKFRDRWIHAETHT